MARKMLTMRSLLALVLLSAGTPWAATIFVDASNPNCPGTGTQADPFCKIQDAIDAAGFGDTIFVAPGTYVENIDFFGKEIAVIGSGPAVTIIDGNRAGSVVTFKRCESPKVRLELFTIRNGSATEGGGIHCDFYSSPTIRYNVIRDNQAKNGGGIASSHSQSVPSIASNTITQNMATKDGGGIYGGATTITNNIIISNDAGGSGGGVASSATITYNTITSNTAGAGGGGIIGRGIVRNNTISGNSAIYGGGIWCNRSAAVENNRITANSAVVRGGGIYCHDSPFIHNNLISGNVVTIVRGDGGGISSRGFTTRLDSPVITNNTITSNGSQGAGGGIAVVFGDSPIISGNFISGNAAYWSFPSFSGGGGIYIFGGTPLVTKNTITYNTARSGGGAITVSGGSLTISHNTIGANASMSGGGALAISSYQGMPVAATMTDNVIVRNTNYYGSGGAVHVYGAGATFTATNNTFYSNGSGVSGGAIHVAGGSSTITNSILWGDTPGEVSRSGAGAISIGYSNVQGGYAGGGNINQNPLFLDPTGGDFRLDCASPCVDAGTDSPPGLQLPGDDLEGDARMVDGNSDGTARVDMGADEFDTLWKFNAPPAAPWAGQPASFTAMAPPAESGNHAFVFVSGGDGGTSGGVVVPMSGGRRLRLDGDTFFAQWLTAMPVLHRGVILGACPGTSTVPFQVPSGFPVGMTLFYAGISVDMNAGVAVSVTPTHSFVTQ